MFVKSRESPKVKMGCCDGHVCDVRLWNIIVLGVSFMLIFTAFQTCSMVEKTVLDSAKNERNSTFNGDGYTSLGIIYIGFSVSNWIAPSFVSFAGPKISMIVGALMYFLFILSFLHPMEWALYLGSVLVGFGAAILWTAQGTTLTINSDTETISRNSGIFWALLQCSLLFGNLYSYFVFKGKNTVTPHERTVLFIGLTVAVGLGIICLLFLRKKRTTDAENLINITSSATHSTDGGSSPLQALKRSFQLLKTKEILCLSITFAYTGLALTFFSGVYGTCISNSEVFGSDRKGLLGLAGIAIGVGEIFGGSVFGLFGKRTNTYGRDPIIMLGYLVHLVAFYLTFMNLPSDSPITSSNLPTYMESKKQIALFCGFLLGLGDSCFNTQIYSLLGFMFPEDSSPAFALFKFVQSLMAAVAFYYSLVLHLEWQLLILVVMGTGATLSFSAIEWSSTKTFREGYQSIL
ncbi:UNC93-like protein MFSD11 [Gigantopelta aegis]|uniref:UNC93-like protein MFSD11 n=1 Tax=Gigantopelta aegis TaxID=1735272 RepID=UPI001B88AD85|nr:UNC93-like protein MFSD11 [Gigantopelta aegis]